MKSKILYCAVAILLSAQVAWSQQLESIETERFVMTGYGDVKYESADLTDSRAFSGRFVPIFLFRLNKKMHAEAELEISQDAEGETEVELEYANIHYFLTDTTTVTAGKFLLPFGQFGSNWHPSWINRTPWTPGIYGSHGGSQAMKPLLPVLSDVGVAVQQTIPLTGNQKVFLQLFLTNGARSEAEEEEEAEEHAEEEAEETLPEVAFESTNGDNNKDKAVGGRLAYAYLPSLEFGASYYKTSYDEEEELDIVANGLDINVLVGRNFLFRGEYIRTETDGLVEEEEEEGEDGEEGKTKKQTFKREGWFWQAALQARLIDQKLDGIELVLEQAEARKIEEATRWVYGINYWLDTRSVLKLAHEITDLREDKDDSDGDPYTRTALMFSYGF